MLGGSETCFGTGLGPKITQLEVKRQKLFYSIYEFSNSEFSILNFQIRNVQFRSFKFLIFSCDQQLKE